MSAIKIFDTNTIMEPIQLCVGGKLYRIEGDRSLKYTIYQSNGQEYLKLENVKPIPIPIKEKELQ